MFSADQAINSSLSLVSVEKKINVNLIGVMQLQMANLSIFPSNHNLAMMVMITLAFLRNSNYTVIQEAEFDEARIIFRVKGRTRGRLSSYWKLMARHPINPGN